MALFCNETGSGFPLLIMHGLFGQSDNWVTLGRKYAGHFHVHMLDMPNHGRSPHYDDLSYPFMAEKVLEFMNERGLEQAHLIGHSMGGKIAMQLAVTQPGRVSKLVVADIGPKAYPVHHQTVILALQHIDTAALKNRGEAEETMIAYGLDPGTRQFLLKNLYWKEPERLDWRFNLPVIAAQISEVGKPLAPDAHFNGPALFIRGGKSGYVQDEDMNGIRSHFPQAELQTVEGAGHWVHAEKPLDFYDKTLAFLKSW